MGDKAPADCVVINAVNCTVDEAHMTNEACIAK
jgi:magnesium-transporting ATPase (P-type)